MSLKTIQILIQEDGSYQTDFSNFTGADCLGAGKQMHALLAQSGIQTEQAGITPKPELLAVQDRLQETVATLETHQETQ